MTLTELSSALDLRRLDGARNDHDGRKRARRHLSGLVIVAAVAIVREFVRPS